MNVSDINIWWFVSHISVPSTITIDVCTCTCSANALNKNCVCAVLLCCAQERKQNWNLFFVDHSRGRGTRLKSIRSFQYSVKNTRVRFIHCNCFETATKLCPHQMNVTFGCPSVWLPFGDRNRNWSCHWISPFYFINKFHSVEAIQLECECVTSCAELH